MNIPLRCRCGKLQGEVDTKRVAARAVCYCKDCQAFARFLKAEATMLDASGGTEVEATQPAALRFTRGLEHLACMSLSAKGIYRAGMPPAAIRFDAAGAPIRTPRVLTREERAAITR